MHILVDVSSILISLACVANAITTIFTNKRIDIVNKRIDYLQFKKTEQEGM